jgi:hypothetical protein
LINADDPEDPALLGAMEAAAEPQTDAASPVKGAILCVVQRASYYTIAVGAEEVLVQVAVNMGCCD